jgi:hypothetical protein
LYSNRNPAFWAISSNRIVGPAIEPLREYALSSEAKM